MLYHRRHSKPLMQQLKAMCEEKIKSRLVEPSSPLWEPMIFIVNQWDRADIPVRYLAGSFNYQSEDGATVGDHVMSLVATARANDVEPVAYLTECLRCHEDLARRPEYYLPWVYRQRMKEGDSPPAPARQRSSPAARREPAPSHPVSRQPAHGLRDLAPEVREGAALRVAAPDQDLQLAGEQR